MNYYVEEFKEYLINVKHCSNNTLESYIRDINQFVSYCQLKSVSKFTEIDEKFINSYIENLISSGKSLATKTRVIASIRCYFKYLTSVGAISSNPTSAIKNPRTEKKLPGILDSKDVIQLLSEPKGNDFKSIRDKAMLEIMYATGIRVSELINLKVNDVNLQIGILTLHGEKNERIIPIYQTAVKHLSDYIQNARPAIISEDSKDILFTNMNGQPLSRQGCWKIIKHYADKAGIKGEITPHTLRHSFATHLLENGAQLKDIKEMLGHSDISSTQVYAQLLKSKYVQSYSKFHPLAK